MNKQISVAIVTWNSADYIETCLRSLADANSEDLEIIVIDNQSSDSTMEVLRRFADVDVIETGLNLGFAPAMNIALRRVTGEYVCLLNPDTVVSSTALYVLRAFLEQNPSVAAVGPRQINEFGTTIAFGARPFPSIWESFLRQFGLAKLLPGDVIQGKEVNYAFLSNRPSRVPALNGAAMMVRKSAIEKIGLLDETIPMYFEDLDLCARILEEGSIYYLPEAVITHWGAKSADRAPVRKLLYAMENGEAPWLYFQRYGFRASASLYHLLIFVGSMYRLALVLPSFAILRTIGAKVEGLSRIRAQAIALLWWSLCSKKRFRNHVQNFFSITQSAVAEPAISATLTLEKEKV